MEERDGFQLDLAECIADVLKLPDDKRLWEMADVVNMLEAWEARSGPRITISTALVALWITVTISQEPQRNNSTQPSKAEEQDRPASSLSAVRVDGRAGDALDEVGELLQRR